MGKGGIVPQKQGVEEKKKALNGGKRIVEKALKTLFLYITNVDNLPDHDNEKIKISLFKKEDINQAQVNADESYVKMGLKPTKQFFINRGYKEDEFELEEGSVSTTSKDFASNDNFDELLDVFDNCQKGFKKSPIRRKTTRSG